MSRPRTDTARDVREAIADADVAADELLAGLADVGGIGGVTVRDGVASVEVTLPIPAAEVRDAVRRDLGEAVADVEGVDDFQIEWAPSAADPGARVDLIPDVKNVIAVSSGKGGVGKSTVAVNLAAALADAGAAVGLLDADVYGPNAPAMLGLDDATPHATLDDEIVPRESHGVTVMSMGFIVGEDDPVIWRGPMVDDVVTQLFGDVSWGALDYLIVDLPPGTGDAQLTLAQHLPVAGAVLVTTPQAVATDDTRRGLEQFARYGVPVLGVAENMAGFECPDCGSTHDLFGTGGAEALAGEFSVPLLGNIPLDPSVGVLDAEPPDPTGIEVPFVGRIGLPRTREERESSASLPPVALREDGGPTRASLRLIATRVAARVDSLVE